MTSALFVDQTASIPNFTADEVNRVAWEQSDAGGKGINAASFLAYFGYTVAVTGVLGTDDLRRLDRPTACRHRFGCRKTTAALAQPLI